MTSSNGNIFRVTGPLCGEFTGHRWIPLTKASDAELWCFLWSTPRINVSANNRETGDLRRHRSYYDVIVMSDHCFVPVQHRTITWTNANIQLDTRIYKTFFIFNSELNKFSFKEMFQKMLSANWWPFDPSFNVLTHIKLRGDTLESILNTKVIRTRKYIIIIQPLFWENGHLWSDGIRGHSKTTKSYISSRFFSVSLRALQFICTSVLA